MTGVYVCDSHEMRHAGHERPFNVHLPSMSLDEAEERQICSGGFQEKLTALVSICRLDVFLYDFTTIWFTLDQNHDVQRLLWDNCPASHFPGTQWFFSEQKLAIMQWVHLPYRCTPCYRAFWALGLFLQETKRPVLQYRSWVKNTDRRDWSNMM